MSDIKAAASQSQPELVDSISGDTCTFQTTNIGDVDSSHGSPIFTPVIMWKAHLPVFKRM
ncbi:MAG: hypothetical protein PF637_02675 [Spirochaetes bacterium]|nr:hypothetical protein [Spirochaetota bacterium]